MSITDDASGLDTSYQEQTVVAFQAGTLANIAALVSEIESKLRRGTLSASTVPTSTQVQNWIIRKKEELAEAKNFTFKRRYAYASAAAGTYRYALPPDFNGGWVRLKDTTNDLPITLWEPDKFDRKYPDPSSLSSDDVFVGTIKGMELWLAPPPAGTYQLEIEYERSGADQTSTDVSWIPEPDRWKICDGALEECFMALHMWQQAAIYRSKWQQGLGAAIRADGKRRWANMNFQAISVFQTDNYRVQ